MTKCLYEAEDQEILAKIGFFYLQWVAKGGSVVDASVADPLLKKYFSSPEKKRNQLQTKQEYKKGERTMFSVCIRCYNHFNEIVESTIVDSSTKSGATRKANSWLKDTFFKPRKKFSIDNYQYWNCYDIADREE